MSNGCLIVCDGSNGAGKSSVIKHLSGWLSEAGHHVLVTREPGGTPIGEKIREVVLDPSTPELCDTTELLLFAAARAQHLQEKIIPAVEGGAIVICDRFTPATIAFQHFGRGIPLQLVREINEIALGGFKPSLNIILDIDPAVGMQRVAGRGEVLDRLELQKAEFLSRARYGFLVQAQDNPETFAVVDASQSFEGVTADVKAVVEGLLARLA
jgi:dTMP kinase